MKRHFIFVEVILDPKAKCALCSEPVLGPYWALYVRVKTDVYEHRVCAPCVVALGMVTMKRLSSRLARSATYGRRP